MTIAETKIIESGEKTTQTVAGTGLAAGLLASSCCVLPLLLLSAGIGGAWMSRLTALAPYQPLFLGVAAAALGWGFWRSYRRKDCVVGSSCDSPRTSRTTRGLLWFGATATLIAMSIDLVAPLIS